MCRMHHRLWRSGQGKASVSSCCRVFTADNITA
uniref:Uncharacterized protein n=1 Tax=Arundo donax TaxID=35708 RepID=A0A0A9C3X0_ARUDO